METSRSAFSEDEAEVSEMEEALAWVDVCPPTLRTQLAEWYRPIELGVRLALTGDLVTLVRVEHAWTSLKLKSLINSSLPVDRSVCSLAFGAVTMSDKQTVRELGLTNGDVVLATLTDRHQHIVDGQVIFEWSQTQEAATIFICPPANVGKRDIHIRISSRTLRIGCRRAPCALKATFHKSVDKRTSLWTMRNIGSLQIFLRKEIPAEWPYILELQRNAPESWQARDQPGGCTIS
mmetsp:Transcript_34345/g.61901  ORF Transcript_34345/g.61901 Transcript_34345/m.61901 type:complete len:235 (+) Transcript_34345:117-821(+)